jgi:hypothetical protein
LRRQKGCGKRLTRGEVVCRLPVLWNPK